MTYTVFPGFDLYYTDPAQDVISKGRQKDVFIDDLDRDTSDACKLSCFRKRGVADSFRSEEFVGSCLIQPFRTTPTFRRGAGGGVLICCLPRSFDH